VWHVMVGEDCWSGPHLDFRVSSPSFSKYNAHILLRDHDQGRIRAGKSTYTGRVYTFRSCIFRQDLLDRTMSSWVL
jgi:hypothetical protein